MKMSAQSCGIAGTPARVEPTDSRDPVPASSAHPWSVQSSSPPRRYRTRLYPHCWSRPTACRPSGQVNPPQYTARSAWRSGRARPHGRLGHRLVGQVAGGWDVRGREAVRREHVDQDEVGIARLDACARVRRAGSRERRRQLSPARWNPRDQPNTARTPRGPARAGPAQHLPADAGTHDGLRRPEPRPRNPESRIPSQNRFVYLLQRFLGQLPVRVDGAVGQLVRVRREVRAGLRRILLVEREGLGLDRRLVGPGLLLDRPPHLLDVLHHVLPAQERELAHLPERPPGAVAAELRAAVHHVAGRHLARCRCRTACAASSSGCRSRARLRRRSGPAATSRDWVTDR